MRKELSLYLHPLPLLRKQGVEKVSACENVAACDYEGRIEDADRV